MPSPDLLLTVQILDENDNVLEERIVTTYRKLLEAAHAAGLKEVRTKLVAVPSAISREIAVVRATVLLPKGTFTGLGDASPESVPEKLKHATVRVAETRSVCRAIRAALGVAFVAVEELSDPVRFLQKQNPEPRSSTPDAQQPRTASPNRGSSTARPPHRFGRGSDTTSSSQAPPAEERRALTDDQKRLVFRLAYELGATRENVRERVLAALGVQRLEHATKTDGSRAIENLKREVAARKQTNGRGHQNGASPHAN